MSKHSVVSTIDDDGFALGWIAGEKVIVTQSGILGDSGSEWEGSPIFCKAYLLRLIELSMEHGVISSSDVRIFFKW